MTIWSRFEKRARDLIKTLKTGEPVLNLNGSVAAESLWPTKLEQEADKASIILRSFGVDGFIVPYKLLRICPKEVFRHCQGLAIFHVLRAGLHSPEASGSGVLISRLSDGRWSGASAIAIDYKLPTLVDVADVVIVVNRGRSLEMIKNSGSVLGRNLSIEPGPIPQNGILVQQPRTNIQTEDSNFVYAKSKGQLLDIDLRHLIIPQRDQENERFYGLPGISAQDILSGLAVTPSGASDQLYRTLEVLEKENADLGGLPGPGGCPGDRRIRPPVKTFA